MMVTR